MVDNVPFAQLLTLAEAAQQVGISHSHLRLLARQGKIWTLKKGKLWLTTEAAIRHYLAAAPRPGPKGRAKQT